MNFTEATLKIASSIDATHLPFTPAELSESEVHELLIEKMMDYRFGCLCIYPSTLHEHAALLKESAQNSGFRLCTVIDFPNGTAPLTKRVGQLAKAIDDGTDEVDIVIPIYAFYGGKRREIQKDITLLANVAANPGHDRPPATVKVILETGYWGQQQLEELVKLLNEVPGIAYYKTSTGRDPKVPISEKVEHIKLMQQLTDRKIKVSGGLRSLEDYIATERAGATCFGIGMDAAINIVEEAAGHDS